MIETLARETQKLSVEGMSALARERGLQEFWRDEKGGLNWHQFGSAITAVRDQCVRGGVRSGEVVVTSGESTPEALAWLFGTAAVGAVVAPLRRERRKEIKAWTEFMRIDWCENDGQLERVAQGNFTAMATALFEQLRGRAHPGLILATGGTTGRAKIVLHDLESLLNSIPVKNSVSRRTLPLMRFDHIGGLDMAWRALAGRQVLVAAPAELTPSAVAKTIALHGVEVMPATPSFLNLLLLSGAAETHDLSSLRLVPYGAEPMQPGLLARLRFAFPRVEFVQRFGTSETGVLPVSDEIEGIRLRFDKPGYDWKVVDGELWVLTPTRALGYLSGDSQGFAKDGWFQTGDLVEQRPDGIIRVIGRRAEMINVGGEKVLPTEVEHVLLTHPLVADCRVTPEFNAVLGQIVVAEIVWRGPETDALQVKRILISHAGQMLARHKLPAAVRLVSVVDTTRNFKKARVVTA